MKQVLLWGLLLISSWSGFGQAIDNGASSRNSTSPLDQQKWIHGSANCKLNTDVAIEVFRYDHSSFILRQNKCMTFEAPFIYVLVGEEKALVLDTGAATESAVDFLLYETVRSLVNEKARRDGKAERELIVIHSHSHSDHYAGDYQFKGKVNVSVVEPNSASVARFFAFRQSPSGVAIIELGGRKLTILPTPGHQEEAITVYDPQTRWLLTGDTFYPGYIYVKDWDEYKMSIDRLVSFSRTHEVRALLGSHIEMTNREREYYPVGTNYQPDEAPLALKPESLVALDLELKKLEVPEKIVLNALIVAPMNIFQKAISNITRWIIQGST